MLESTCTLYGQVMLFSCCLDSNQNQLLYSLLDHQGQLYIHQDSHVYDPVGKTEDTLAFLAAHIDMNTYRP